MGHFPKRWPAGRWVRPLSVGLALLAAATVAGCQLPSFGVNPGGTTQAHNSFRLWQGAVIAALAIAAIVWGLIFWSVIRYRRRDEHHIPKQTRENLLVEVIYTVTPVLLVAALFFFTVVVENRVNDTKPPAQLSVAVTAFQWGWRFDYPQYHISIIGNYNNFPQMVLPIDETVRIHLMSTDVVHSFYVPAFNFQRYAQPDIKNQYFDFNITQVGTYDGKCSQYCGLYHSQMRFTIKAVTQQDFQGWLASQEPKAAA